MTNDPFYTAFAAPPRRHSQWPQTHNHALTDYIKWGVGARVEPSFGLGKERLVLGLYRAVFDYVTINHWPDAHGAKFVLSGLYRAAMAQMDYDLGRLDGGTLMEALGCLVESVGLDPETGDLVSSQAATLARLVEGDLETQRQAATSIMELVCDTTVSDADKFDALAALARTIGSSKR